MTHLQTAKMSPFHYNINYIYNIEKPKYFKKGLTHYFIYYLCSKFKANISI